MANDQFRHLHHHYEFIDEYRCELMTPFFDSDFLRYLLSIPIDRFLGHAFYYNWMERFPASVREVPWQAYPGHLPCPLPLSPEEMQARSQWETSRKQAWMAAREPFVKCLRHAFHRLDPELGIPHRRVLLALLVHMLRLRNGVGMFNTFNSYRHYSDKSNGEMSRLGTLG